MTSLPEPHCWARSFVGKGCKGNLHALFVAGTQQQLFAWSKKNPQIIAAYLYKSAAAVWGARFFQNGTEILRCGSGKLAVAAYLNSEVVGLKFGLVNTARITKRVPLQTATETTELLIGRDERFGYISRSLPQHPINNKPFWQRVLRRTFVNGAYAGGKGDYVILQLDNVADLQALQPSLSLLKQFSRRALIATSKYPYSRCYALRYFAPQYGNSEDPATGSANVQLLRYWSRMGLSGELSAKQLSKAGGVFYGAWRSTGTELWGEVVLSSEMPL